MQLDPKNWGELLFHSREIKHLQRFIAEDNHPPAVTVSGNTGSGKTAAVKLYVKSTLCLNRKHGEYEPCGKCAVCQSDPRTSGAINNIIWVQRGQDEKLSAQFNKALEEASTPPYGMDEKHRHYKFIVFDELQSVPRDRLQDLLYYPELEELISRNNVIFIFLTMDESKIDSAIFQPLMHRTFYLSFKKLTEEQIEKYLSQRLDVIRKENKLNPIPVESKKIIAHYADGSIRGALTAYEKCALDDDTLSPLSVSETLYYASNEVRKELWLFLQNSSWKELTDWWKRNSESINADILINQMLRDIDNTMINIGGKPEHLKAKDLLYSYITSRARVRAFDVIKMLVGLKVDCHRYIVQLDLERSGYETIHDQVKP